MFMPVSAFPKLSLSSFLPLTFDPVRNLDLHIAGFYLLIMD